MTLLVTAKSANSHSTIYSWEQFLCNRWDNCWMGTMGSWGLRLWHWGRQWSCRWLVDYVL